jgi:hypothetical protein
MSFSSSALADLLLALQSLVQRLRTQPPEHPSVATAAQGLERALLPLLRARERLVIEVRSVQLTVDGMETNPDYEPLRDLAIHCREAGVGAIEFRAGVTVAELVPVLGTLAVGAPLSATPHCLLRPLLPPAAAGLDPWLVLERLLLDDPDRTTAARHPTELGIALELNPAGARGDAQLLAALTAVAVDAVGDPAGRDALVEFLDAAPAEALRRLLSPAGDREARHRFLTQAVPLLPPGSLLRLIQALVPGREARISGASLRLLARLTRDDNTQARPALELALDSLVDGREADHGRERQGGSLEPERVLTLAFETGIVERGTLAAADRMIVQRKVAPLLALLDTVPREDPVARAVRGQVYHPRTVRQLLSASPVDLDLLDKLIPAVGIEAAPALLDALAQSPERRVRLKLLDLLVRYGSAVGPLAAERIPGMPWYVQRNLLALLGRLSDLPAGFSPAPLLSHRDPRVSHEAIALALTDPVLRDSAAARGLEAHHEPTNRLALTALADYCPPDLLPRLLARATDPASSAEMRALAVSAMAPVNDPVVLRFLRRLVVAPGLTGLGRLAPKSAPMLAALRGLAAHWSQHPKAGPVLDAARQSRDEEVREAGRPPTRRSSSGSYRVTPG